MTSGIPSAGQFPIVPPFEATRPKDRTTSPGIGDVAGRLEQIVNAIQEFAELKFQARAPVSREGDIVDAVAAGVNFLGEELEASYGELERRVANRTEELAAMTKELARRALHDELTGLPNRSLFWDRLTLRLHRADRSRTGFAVLLMDLDNFKEVNDTLGHAAGDLLLVEVASRIRGALRAGDSAARVGGDEFLILLDEVDTPEMALFIARRLHRSLVAPYQVGDHQRSITLSIGVALGSDSFDDPDAMVAAADNAMYEAKRHARGQCVLFHNDHRSVVPLSTTDIPGRTVPE